MIIDEDLRGSSTMNNTVHTKTYRFGALTDEIFKERLTDKEFQGEFEQTLKELNEPKTYPFNKWWIKAYFSDGRFLEGRVNI